MVQEGGGPGAQCSYRQAREVACALEDASGDTEVVGGETEVGLLKADNVQIGRMTTGAAPPRCLLGMWRVQATYNHTTGSDLLTHRALLVVDDPINCLPRVTVLRKLCLVVLLPGGSRLAAARHRNSFLIECRS